MNGRGLGAGFALGPEARLARRAARTKFVLVYLVVGWLLLVVGPVLALDRLEAL